jgi:hypothetical protein
MRPDAQREAPLRERTKSETFVRAGGSFRLSQIATLRGKAQPQLVWTERELSQAWPEIVSGRVGFQPETRLESKLVETANAGSESCKQREQFQNVVRALLIPVSACTKVASAPTCRLPALRTRDRAVPSRYSISAASAPDAKSNFCQTNPSKLINLKERQPASFSPLMPESTAGRDSMPPKA